VASAKRRTRSGPPSPESRLTSKVLSVRLSPQARAELTTLAARWGLSVSAAVARLAHEASERRE
jgi:predicted HicB family RNase H-like nuclease